MENVIKRAEEIRDGWKKMEWKGGLVEESLGERIRKGKMMERRREQEMVNKFLGRRLWNREKFKMKREEEGMKKAMEEEKRRLEREERLREQEKKMVKMLEEGYREEEIEEELGKNRGWVERELRTRKVKKVMIERIRETLAEEIRKILEKEVVPALEMLKSVMEDEKARPEVRAAAANSILDRYMGKATQPIETKEKRAEEMSDEELKRKVEEYLVKNGPTERI